MVRLRLRKMEIPGQEATDDPVIAYRVFDRYDGRVIMSGVEVQSKVDELIERQVWLMGKASIGPDLDFTLFRRDSQEEDGS